MILNLVLINLKKMKNGRRNKLKKEEIKINKDATKARKAKEANEDRKAQILSEIMKYEKIDENTIKIKIVKKPWYTIDPLSWFHFIHSCSVLVNIFIIIIWISFESSFNEEFTVIIKIVYFIN